MDEKQFDYGTFIYKIFLILLIMSQLHLLFYHEVNMYILAASGFLLVYLTFRFYLLNKLGNKAKYLSLTLTEFLQKRENYDSKCKEQQDKKDDVKI